MLHNIMLCVLIAYVMVTPLFYAKAVKFGMRIANDDERAADEITFSLPKPKKKPKMTPEEMRSTQILANVDRYDGTSAGQEKINVSR